MWWIDLYGTLVNCFNYQLAQSNKKKQRPALLACGDGNPLGPHFINMDSFNPNMDK